MDEPEDKPEDPSNPTDPYVVISESYRLPEEVIKQLEEIMFAPPQGEDDPIDTLDQPQQDIELPVETLPEESVNDIEETD